MVYARRFGEFKGVFGNAPAIILRERERESMDPFKFSEVLLVVKCSDPFVGDDIPSNTDGTDCPFPVIVFFSAPFSDCVYGFLCTLPNDPCITSFG